MCLLFAALVFKSTCSYISSFKLQSSLSPLPNQSVNIPIIFPVSRTTEGRCSRDVCFGYIAFTERTLLTNMNFRYVPFICSSLKLFSVGKHTCCALTSQSYFSIAMIFYTFWLGSVIKHTKKKCCHVQYSNFYVMLVIFAFWSKMRSSMRKKRCCESTDGQFCCWGFWHQNLSVNRPGSVGGYWLGREQLLQCRI